MKIVPIISGARFGRLTVLSQAVRPAQLKNHYKYWLCQCDCGATKIIISCSLRGGTTTSCGCYRNEIAAKLARELGLLKKTHGYTVNGHSPEYRSWSHAKDRCSNPKSRDWSAYGAIGITMCDEWKSSFANFIRDMGLRPSPKHSLDRFPDPHGNYEPGNCRWATATEQANNQRLTEKRNVIIEFGGLRKSLSQWARTIGISPSAMTYRIKHWGISKALTHPAELESIIK